MSGAGGDMTMDRDTKRVVLTGDPIAKPYRDIIGNAARVHIPLRDAVNLRHVAEHLVGLAAVLRRLSHDTTEEQWRLLFRARQEIKATDELIRQGVVPPRR
jgi:hypothetical protein